MRISALLYIETCIITIIISEIIITVSWHQFSPSLFNKHNFHRPNIFSFITKDAFSLCARVCSSIIQGQKLLSIFKMKISGGWYYSVLYNPWAFLWHCKHFFSSLADSNSCIVSFIRVRIRVLWIICCSLIVIEIVWVCKLRYYVQFI